MKSIYNKIIYFILFVPPLVFFTNLTRNPYYFQIVLLNSVTLILWILYIYKCNSSENKIDIIKTPLDVPIISFFVIATISWLVILIFNINTPYIRYSIFNEGLKRWLYLLTNSILVYYAVIYFVNNENRKSFIKTTFWVGFLASLYGILQYYGIELFWPRVLNPFGGRCVSSFGNPNFLSTYLVLLFPLLFVYLIYEQSKFKKIVFTITLFAVYIALLCTLTRSSWLGIFVATIVCLVLLLLFEKQFLKKKLKFIVIILASMFLLIFLWPRSNVAGYKPNAVERLLETGLVKKEYYGAWFQRKLIWSCAWYMVVENPFLGKGWGCFELFFPFYQGRHLFLEAYKDQRTHANNTHNEILEIWSQTGTIGFGIYLLLISALCYYSIFLIRNLKGENRFLAIALFSSLVGVWADNLLNVSMHFAVPGFLYWWQMGLLVGLGRTVKKEIRINTIYKKAILYFLIAFGILIIAKYTMNFMGEVKYFSGFKHSKRNDVQKAIPELEAAHKYQRFEVNANYELANSYARAGDKEKAIWGYKEALRANAGYDEIYFNMATVLLQQGRVNEAIPEYSKSILINPSSFESYAALGSIFLNEPEKYGEAGVELFKQCVIFFPNNKDIWNNLGFLYTKIKNNEKAYESYKKAILIDPDFELAKRNIYVILKKLGRKDKELIKIDELFRKTEDNINKGKWREALVLAKELVKIVPRSAKARFYLANIHFTIGDIKNAIVEYQECIKLNGEYLAARVNLGLAYVETQKFILARKEFELVLSKDPNNQIAKETLEKLKGVVQFP